MKLQTIVAIAASALTAVHAADCSFMCPSVYDPVCGSDGVTYSNDCTFQSTKCASNDSNLTIVSNGQCGATKLRGSASDCPTACTTIWQPVCGSDGATYPNECMLAAKKCATKDKKLKIMSKGECTATKAPIGSGGSDCTAVCPSVWQPVCGSDGKTYSNECSLNIARCKSKKITLAAVGECKKPAPPVTCAPAVCQEIYKPVCGSDGKTYPNQCELDAAKCGNPKLALAANGKCTKK